jgi:nucleotide-binding universal stress UspA family protein
MYNRIEVPLDGSSLAEKALPCAIGLARQLQAQLLLVGVCDPPLGEIYLPEQESKLLHRIETYLADLKKAITSPAYSARLQEEQVKVLAVAGKAAKEIVKIGQLEKVELVVMSTHGASALARLLMGSVAFEVLRHSCTPVILLRPVELDEEMLTLTTLSETGPTITTKQAGPVVVTLDGSARAEAALEPAVNMARQLDTELFLLRVMMPRVPFVPYDREKEYEKLTEEAYRYLDGLESSLLSRNVRCSKVVRVGDPVAEILDYIRKSKPVLLVMATHAGSSLREVVLGSVASEVMRQSHYPIMLVHHST